MLQQHVNSGADVTVGCLVVPRMEATGFGVMQVDANDTITAFVEKPKDPPGIPGNEGMALASMGIYVFNTDFLFEQLRRDADDPASKRDFGGDIIPYIVKHGKAVAHRFTNSCIRAAEEIEEYWRDVGTLDAYFEANLDLTDTVPKLNLYDRDWPIWTDAVVAAPAKFVHDEEMRFRVIARRNKLLGHWAAQLMKLSPVEAEAYAKDVVRADFEEAGDEDVIRKVLGDLTGAGVEVDDAAIRQALSDQTVEAKRQLMQAQG